MFNHASWPKGTRLASILAMAQFVVVARRRGGSIMFYSSTSDLLCATTRHTAKNIGYCLDVFLHAHCILHCKNLSLLKNRTGMATQQRTTNFLARQLIYRRFVVSQYFRDLDVCAGACSIGNATVMADDSLLAQ